MDLKTYRVSKNLDQREGAEKAGISHSAFNTAELGTRFPGTDTLLKLVRWSKGEVTPTDLFLTWAARQGEKLPKL